MAQLEAELSDEEAYDLIQNAAIYHSLAQITSESADDFDLDDMA